VQVVAIDPSAVFRKALRMWLPRTAVSVDAFHLVLLGNNMLTEVRQRLTQELKGRRGRTADPVRANRRLLLRAGETLSDRGRDRLRKVFDLDDPAGTLQAAWLVKEQLRDLLNPGSLADAAAAKDRLQSLPRPGIAAGLADCPLLDHREGRPRSCTRTANAPRTPTQSLSACSQRFRRPGRSAHSPQLGPCGAARPAARISEPPASPQGRRPQADRRQEVDDHDRGDGAGSHDRGEHDDLEAASLERRRPSEDGADECTGQRDQTRRLRLVG
jgi:hypothetical protein